MQLEGKKSILPAVQAGVRSFEIILIKANATMPRFQDLIDEAEKRHITIKYVSESELDRMAQGKTHGGIIALCSRRRPNRLEELDQIVSRSIVPPLLLLIEGVEDDQHLGYLLRTSEACGVQAVLLKKHLWDFNETAVARSSSGAYERLPLIKISRATELNRLKRLGVCTWGCIANARRTIYDVDLTLPTALAVGGEKRGLSGKVRELCDGFLRIPMFSGSSTSLAMTHAACLILGEAARQRWSSAKRSKLNRVSGV